MGAFLMGCTPVSKDYYEINYLNNYENGGYFKNSVVSKDGLIKRPSNPKREGYLFQGWSTSKDEFIEFTQFDEQPTKDLTLYASWVEDNESLNDLFKAKLFKKYVSWVELPTVKATRNSQIIIQYYSPVEYVGSFEGKDVFERYNNYTTCDTYVTEEDESETKTASTKYYYDNKYFYKDYRNFEDSNKNKVTTSPFADSQVEDFLNIGFYNLNLRDFDKVIKGLEDGKTEDDLFLYDIKEISLADFNSKAEYFEFSFFYEQDVYNEEQGMTLHNVYIYDGSIHFKNNSIWKSKVIRYNAVGVNNEIMMEEMDTDTIVYETGDFSR